MYPENLRKIVYNPKSGMWTASLRGEHFTGEDGRKKYMPDMKITGRTYEELVELLALLGKK